MSFGEKQLEEDFEGLSGQFVTVDSVILPPWAKNRHIFVYRMYAGLEHPNATRTIHNWVDLIFGDKQQDPERYNLFKPLTSEKIVKDREESKSPLGDSDISQIAEFGHNPIQILDKPQAAIEDRSLDSPKVVFDSFYGPQNYMAIAYKLKDSTENAGMIIRVICKDRSNIYTINSSHEMYKKQ